MNENSFYNDKKFIRRGTACFFLVLLCLFSCILRVMVISNKDYSVVAARQSALRLSAGAARGSVFDCNMVPITNSERRIIAAVSPTPRAITAISNILEGKALEDTLERLKGGKPVLCEVDSVTECDGIAYTYVYSSPASDTIANHIIGYTNADNHGVSGIEKAYDEYLYSGKNVDFVYTADAKGDILAGIEPTIENEDFAMSNGVVSTLEINIQNIVEQKSNLLDSGCIIVSECDSGKIRAITSRPNYDIGNITDALEDKRSPLLNRATCAYSVGSVFKLCVAAAGLEEGLYNHRNNCIGYTKIGNRNFNCHKRAGHGVKGLKDAIALSCNTFFYSYSALIGGDKIYDIASSLQFGREIELGYGINADSGNLPDKSILLNGGALANFSIGQGQLLLSPTAMLNLYNCIANGGQYRSPTVIEAVIKDGVVKKSAEGSPTRVLKKENADILKKALRAVIENGTASLAKPTLTDAAGKTSTAQTGKYKNGKEIDRSWFCGFFPAKKPKYTVIVFSEDSSTNKLSCAEIFAQIADSITEYGK